MRRIFISLVMGICVAASAAVTPLPGSTPQTFPASLPSPNPIAVLVTDAAGAALADARVQFTLPAFPNFLAIDGDAAPYRCYYDLGYLCETTADAQGIARLPAFRASRAGQYAVHIGADKGGTYFGNAILSFLVEPAAPLAHLKVVSGTDQQAIIGTPYAAPFVVRAVKPDGRPMAGAPVTFRASSVYGMSSGTFPRVGTFVDRSSYFTTTDAEGYAVAAEFRAGWGLGRGQVVAEVYDAEALALSSTAIDFTNTNADGSTYTSFQDMWWSGPSENGWGMSVAQHGDRLFSVVYAYDVAGDPTWWVLPDGRWDAGLGSSFNGPMYSPRGSPYFAYDARNFAPGRSDGSASLAFTGPEAGTLHGYFGSVLAEKNIARLDIAPEVAKPLRGVADMWWGGAAQNGWGVAIMEQQGGLFAVWFTYDADGRPTWFVMPGGEWTDADTFAGTMYRTRGTPWASGTYDPSALRLVSQGPYRLRFDDASHATLEYQIEGRSGTLTLERQAF